MSLLSEGPIGTTSASFMLLSFVSSSLKTHWKQCLLYLLDNKCLMHATSSHSVLALANKKKRQVRFFLLLSVRQRLHRRTNLLIPHPNAMCNRWRWYLRKIGNYDIEVFNKNQMQCVLETNWRLITVDLSLLSGKRATTCRNTFQYT